MVLLGVWQRCRRHGPVRIRQVGWCPGDQLQPGGRRSHQSVRFSTLAGQQSLVDVTTFFNWLEAVVDEISYRGDIEEPDDATNDQPTAQTLSGFTYERFLQRVPRPRRAVPTRSSRTGAGDAVPDGRVPARGRRGVRAPAARWQRTVLSDCRPRQSDVGQLRPHGGALRQRLVLRCPVEQARAGTLQTASLVIAARRSSSARPSTCCPCPSRSDACDRMGRRTHRCGTARRRGHSGAGGNLRHCLDGVRRDRIHGRTVHGMTAPWARLDCDGRWLTPTEAS